MLLAAPEVDGVLFMHAPTAIVPASQIAAACLPLMQAAHKPVLASWLGGAVVAQAATLLGGCGLVARREGAAPAATGPGARPAAALTREQQWARTAWRYVENNADPDTGLAGGSDRAAVFTVANAADHIAAITCAHELGAIDAREFDQRLSRVLGFLGTNFFAGASGLPVKNTTGTSSHHHRPKRPFILA